MVVVGIPNSSLLQARKVLGKLPVCTHKKMMADEHCDVLILGAGAAGIGAARRLLEKKNDGVANNLKVIVLEARNRVGGRAWTSDELQCGLELDHGGKWIHGSTSQNPRNPMTELAARYQIPTTAGNNDNPTENITRVVLSTRGSGETMQSVVPKREAETASRLLYKQLCQLGQDSLIAPLMHSLPVDTSYKDCLIEIANREMPGKSFAEWLEARARSTLIAAGNPNEKGSLVAETIALLRLHVYDWLESYEGCRLDQCSLLYTESDGTILPGSDADVAGGYGKLVQTLATSVPIDIRCGHRVVSIDRTSSLEHHNGNPQGGVVVCTEEDGSNSKKRFVARLGCIVALPLGVLQPSVDNPLVRDPVFIPPLPESLLGAVDRLAMCLMNKIEVLFPSRWWPDGIGSLTIASENGNASNDFPLDDMPWSHWIVEDDDPSLLVCYATGVFAERIETMSNEDVEREGVEALRHAFLDNEQGGSSNGTHITSIPDPVRTHVTKWRSDPFARGSWTFFKAGTRGMKDVRAFQKFNSEQGGVEKLYFAGEHTCDGSVAGLDIGTVHGAYLSGRLAAEELLIKNGANMEQTIVDRNSDDAACLREDT